MPDKNLDLYEAIEHRKMALTNELVAEVEKRDAANKRIAEIRAEIDDLPVRKTRRKSAGRKLADSVVEEKADDE